MVMLSVIQVIDLTFQRWGYTMTASSLHLKCSGPYTWTSGPACVFDAGRDVAGIYLWTIPYREGYLVYYVGETGRSFTERLSEHAESYLTGRYRIWEPAAFSRGEKVLLWDGMWRSDSRNTIGDFLARYPELSAAVHSLFGAMRLFLIPMEADARLRQRVEAALALGLRDREGIVGAFQDSDIRYRPRRKMEPSISVELDLPALIHGVSHTFEA